MVLFFRHPSNARLPGHMALIKQYPVPLFVTPDFSLHFVATLFVFVADFFKWFFESCFILTGKNSYSITKSILFSNVLFPRL